MTWGTVTLSPHGFPQTPPGDEKATQNAAVSPEAQLPGQPGRGALDVLEAPALSTNAPAGTTFWSQGL